MTVSFRLRPYQKAAVAAVVSLYQEQKQRRLLLYLPTGAGKTVIAAYLMKELMGRAGLGRVLFVAHRREILDQTARTIEQHLPKVSVQIEQGERSALGNADVTIASVQSLVRRKERYDPRGFSLIVCDECHRALAPTWEEVIEYFHTRASQDTLLLGMTATPRRTDGKSALDVFGQTAFEISRADLEDLGYLVPMRYFAVRSELCLDKVKLTGGDFQVGALSKIMDAPATRALAIKAWLEQGAGKKTIAFCAGVEHAQHLAEDFASLGVSAYKIDGKTKDRGELIRSFARHEIQVLTNYGVLTEGFDDPGVSCILMARPTTSPLVYTQCIGRGLRPASGKTDCAVIDMVDRSSHQLQYGAAQLAGLPRKWRCRGADPFREARSLAGIKVTSPEVFLRIRDASSLEEVQSILMSLPPEVVVAGLDGEPVLRYEACEGACSADKAEQAVMAVLKQAGVRWVKLTVAADVVTLTFRSPETDNERYAYLKWHMRRITGRSIVYASAGRRMKASPMALLKSMLPGHCRISDLSAEPDGLTIAATVAGLTADEIDEISMDFQTELGIKLHLKGQLSLF
jgi:ATP-dependent helicase IRC3